MSTDYPSWWEIHRRRIIKWGIVLFVLVAFVLGFMPWLIAPWSRINNEEHEIDLYTGQARFTRHILYLQVGREVKETPLSEAIGADENPPQQRQWVKVNIFQPFMRRSPYFTHHGAFGMARYLEDLWVRGDFTPEARAKSARQLLRLWREGGASADRPYTQYIWDLAEEAERRRKSVRADVIPDELVDRILAELNEGAATAPTSRPKTPANGD
ncbi:MAG: hypothetical protein ACOC9S_04585 [Planctomycetota bacterium]